MKNVLVIGASGSLATVVIEELNKVKDVHLTLFLRNKSRLINKPKIATVVEGDVMDYPKLKEAISGQEIVYVNLAGNLEAMTKNIVKAMKETDVTRIIAISSIGIYQTPLRSMLPPYGKLADLIEAPGLDYTILRPDWFTNDNQVDYQLTPKGEPERGTAISRKSIAVFIRQLVESPAKYLGANLNIAKPAR